MNTIYLWACYLSRPGSLSEHESLYLSRALSAAGDAMTIRSRVVDFIQASCLLSMYFLSNGRMLEGSYHASAAASMALQWGLHQLSDVPQVSQMDRDPEYRLDPAKDAIEQGERILAFWQVFNLDRCWSVVLQRPPTIPDSKHPWTSLITPWPQSMEEYETVSDHFVWSETGGLNSCLGSGRAQHQPGISDYPGVLRSAVPNPKWGRRFLYHCTPNQGICPLRRGQQTVN